MLDRMPTSQYKKKVSYVLIINNAVSSLMFQKKKYKENWKFEENFAVLVAWNFAIGITVQKWIQIFCTHMYGSICIQFTSLY